VSHGDQQDPLLVQISQKDEMITNLHTVLY